MNYYDEIINKNNELIKKLELKKDQVNKKYEDKNNEFRIVKDELLKLDLKIINLDSILINYNKTKSLMYKKINESFRFLLTTILLTISLYFIIPLYFIYPLIITSPFIVYDLIKQIKKINELNKNINTYNNDFNDNLEPFNIYFSIDDKYVKNKIIKLKESDIYLNIKDKYDIVSKPVIKYDQLKRVINKRIYSLHHINYSIEKNKKEIIENIVNDKINTGEFDDQLNKYFIKEKRK